MPALASSCAVSAANTFAIEASTIFGILRSAFHAARSVISHAARNWRCIASSLSRTRAARGDADPRGVEGTHRLGIGTRSRRLCGPLTAQDIFVRHLAILKDERDR